MLLGAPGARLGLLCLPPLAGEQNVSDGEGSHQSGLVKSLSAKSGMSISKSRAKANCSNWERRFIYTIILRDQKASEVLGGRWGKHSFLLCILCARLYARFWEYKMIKQHLPSDNLECHS